MKPSDVHWPLVLGDWVTGLDVGCVVEEGEDVVGREVGRGVEDEPEGLEVEGVCCGLDVVGPDVGLAVEVAGVTGAVPPHSFTAQGWLQA